MFLIVSLIIIRLMIKTGIETNKVLSIYNNTNQWVYESEFSNFKEAISFSVFLLLGAGLMLHIYFFTKTKLIKSSKGIKLYSIYRKKPSYIFYWNEIKSI